MALSARILRVRPSPHPRQALTSALRTYHSYDHPQPPGPFNAVEEAILSASLAHVPSHGFTHAALSLGAKDVDYLDVSTNLFPKGPWSLVHYHLVNQRLALAGKTASSREEVGGKRKGVGVKVKELTWERLLANRDIIHRWQEVCPCNHFPPHFRDANAIPRRHWHSWLYLPTSPLHYMSSPS
jgi:ubiquinone biosynthesis protein COQ9